MLVHLNFFMFFPKKKRKEKKGKIEGKINKVALWVFHAFRKCAYVYTLVYILHTMSSMGSIVVCAFKHKIH